MILFKTVNTFEYSYVMLSTLIPPLLSGHLFFCSLSSYDVFLFYNLAIFSFGSLSSCVIFLFYNLAIFYFRSLSSCDVFLYYKLYFLSLSSCGVFLFYNLAIFSLRSLSSCGVFLWQLVKHVLQNSRPSLPQLDGRGGLLPKRRCSPDITTHWKPNQLHFRTIKNKLYVYHSLS